MEQTEPMRRAVAILILIPLLTLAACGGSDKPPRRAPLTNDGATPMTFTGKDSGPFCAIAGPFIHGTDLSAVLTDPASAESRVKELRPLIAEGRRKAPAEIKADVERVADGVARAFDALADANYQAVKVDRSTIDSLIGDQTFRNSAVRVAEYAHQVCKVPG
jgi:hypothetical protein